MSGNKHIREELERIYGAGSMFQRSKCEQYLDTLPKVKGYQRYIREKRYTTKEIKKLVRRMNYHHMQHVSEGGKTTLENGAVVNELEHRYIHDMPRPHEEIVNNHIRQWKIDFMTLTTEGVIDSGEVVQEEETIEIPVHTYRSRQETIERQRRREKRELQQLRKELEDR